jgi:hypothetical protein
MRNKLRFVDIPSIVVVIIAVGAPLVALLA